jgi:hypothetical protein
MVLGNVSLRFSSKVWQSCNVCILGLNGIANVRIGICGESVNHVWWVQGSCVCRGRAHLMSTRVFIWAAKTMR